MKALEVPRRIVVTRKSISEAPEILLTPPVPQSPSIIENLTAQLNRLRARGSSDKKRAFRTPTQEPSCITEEILENLVDLR